MAENIVDVVISSVLLLPCVGQRLQISFTRVLHPVTEHLKGERKRKEGKRGEEGRSNNNNVRTSHTQMNEEEELMQ